MCYTISVRREVGFERDARDNREVTGLGAETPTIEAYRELTKKIKKSLKKVLTKLKIPVIIKV